MVASARSAMRVARSLAEIGLAMTVISSGGQPHSAGSTSKDCIACTLLRAARIGGNSAYS